MTNTRDSTVSKLASYLDAKLLGSSLQVIQESDHAIRIQAGEDISLKVLIDTLKKSLVFDLFSPKLNRIVTFEEIDGVDFLDVRLDDELKSKNHEAEQEDIALAIDLLRIWARQNKYAISQKV